MAIRVLPPLLVNQIAAGEVIERPASVVKELVENAIDAGATRIVVEIELGGTELVRVTDDGRGIPAAELPLALAPHATSKIQAATDLDTIATMGFRGEALASIASVSRLTVRSRAAGEESAFTISGAGDELEDVRPAAGAPGTSVTVRNLFFNTPARRKFLKTERTESGRVTEVVQVIALAHPAIAFELTADGRPVVALASVGEPAQRVLGVLGAELAPELLEVGADASARPDGPAWIRVWGLAGTPAIARATGRHQRVFVNGRPVSDRTINHAVKEAYRGLIEPTRWPTSVLFLEMDPAEVDVNVHPAKAEVRLRHAGVVHGTVLSAVRSALADADLVPGLDLQRAAEASAAVPPLASGLARPSPGGSGDGRTRASALIEEFRHLDSRHKGFVYGEMKEALAREAPELIEREIRGQSAVDVAPAAEPALPTVRTATGALQIHDSYIVTEDEQGVLIIDQHALHERIMFETMLDRLEQGALEAQRLLMPAVVEADRRQVETLDGLASLLARIGIEAESLGPTTIAVHAFTSLLFERDVDPVAFMQDLLARATGMGEGLGDEPEAALHEVLDMMACKAAIKAGDRLEPAEIEALLRRRESVERSTRCPHGRPTSLRLSLRDLERQFGRR